MVVDPTNAPSGTKGWHAIEINYSEGNYYLKAYVFGTQREYSCRRRYSEDWSEWTPTATATKAQEFDLPLAEGYTGTNKYFKTQENLVGLYVNLKKSDSSEIANAVTFGTLPAGFRPSYNVYAPAVACSTVGTVTDVCEVAILPNGSVHAHFNNSGAEYRMRAYVLFAAAS